MADDEHVRYWIIVHSYDGAEESDIEDLISQAIENNYVFMQYEYNDMFAACNEIVHEYRIL